MRDVVVNYTQWGLLKTEDFGESKNGSITD